MARLLKEPLERPSEVLSAREQEKLARTLLAFIEDDREWEAAFSSARSDSLLAQLAAEALEEERAVKTAKLDPDAL